MQKRLTQKSNIARNSANLTKKVKKEKDESHSAMWDLFDQEIECVYDQHDEEEIAVDNCCKTCGMSLMLSDESFYVCSNPSCGKLCREILDESPEWRYYGASDSKTSDPTRCGMPTDPLLGASSIGCHVYCRGGSSNEMRKIGRFTEWQISYKEKSQSSEFEHIRVMAGIAGIPKIIIDDACTIHKMISEEQTFRGLNRDGIIAASIYIACRRKKFPRTAKELAVVFKLDTTSATNGCKNAMSILNSLEKDMCADEKTHLCKMTPHDFIERYCSKLNMNKELTRVCEFIALKIEKQKLMPENTPHSVAAGIIYFISELCKINISKKDVNKVSEISEVTIMKCSKKLQNLKKELVPSTILKKYDAEDEV